MTEQQTLFIETFPQEPELGFYNYNYVTTNEPTIELKGNWKVEFIAGGPTFPQPFEINSLQSWTTLSDGAEAFSGTASYKLSFNKPAQSAGGWLLDLGSVKESAEVFMNGKSLGKLIGPSFDIYVPDADLTNHNTLEVQVTNLMANRIADLDKKNVFWKKFYNINFPARKSENRKNGLFDASGWEPKASGLMGPVTLTPLNRE